MSKADRDDEDDEDDDDDEDDERGRDVPVIVLVRRHAQSCAGVAVVGMVNADELVVSASPPAAAAAAVVRRRRRGRCSTAGIIIFPAPPCYIKVSLGEA